MATSTTPVAVYQHQLPVPVGNVQNHPQNVMTQSDNLLCEIKIMMQQMGLDKVIGEITDIKEILHTLQREQTETKEKVFNLQSENKFLRSKMSCMESRLNELEK